MSRSIEPVLMLLIPLTQCILGYQQTHTPIVYTVTNILTQTRDEYQLISQTITEPACLQKTTQTANMWTRLDSSRISGVSTLPPKIH